MQKTKIKEYTRAIAVIGIMSALAAVCSGTFPMGLTIRVGDFVKLSPIFLLIGIVGNLYGMLGAVLVAFIGDLLQALFSGTGFSPYVSIANVLIGACFGLILYKTNSLLRIIISVLLTQIFGSLILTTMALHLQYGIPYYPTIYWRMLQTAILIAAEIPLLWLVLKKLNIPSKLSK